MKNRFLFVAVVLALVLSGTAMLSYAQGPEGGPGFGHPHGAMGHMFHELNLTDAQKTQIKTMMQAQHANLLPSEQQMGQLRIAMLQATANGNFDQAKVQALATQQAALEAQMAVQRESMQHQIYTQVLTADQRTKADQLRTEAIAHITEHLQKLSQAPATPPAE